jgi:hypothetical protein
VDEFQVVLPLLVERAFQRGLRRLPGGLGPISGSYLTRKANVWWSGCGVADFWFVEQGFDEVWLVLPTS